MSFIIYYLLFMLFYFGFWGLCVLVFSGVLRFVSKIITLNIWCGVFVVMIVINILPYDFWFIMVGC